MPQIYNKYSFGSELGSSLGTGIGQGLNYLAQNKLNEMTQNREINRYSNLLQQSGVDARDANVLAYHAVTNPQNFHHILEQYQPRQSQGQQGQQGQESQQQQPLAQIGQQAQQQAQPNSYRQPTPEQSTQLQKLFQTGGNPEQKPSGLGEGLDLLHRTAKEQLLKTAVGRPAAEQIEAQAPAIQQAQQQLKQQTPQVNQQQVPVQENPNGSATKLAEQLHPLLAKKNALEQKTIREQEHERKKEQREDEKIAREETKEYFQETLKKGKAAETNKLRATKILEKVKEGKLPNATLWNFLTHVEETSAAPLAAVGGLVGGALGAAAGSAAPGAGTVVGGLGGRTLGAAIGSGIGALGSSIAGVTKSLIKSGNPDIEEIEQLSSQFILNAKQYFGARMTDFDARSFLKTTVSLGDTPAGMEKKLKNMIEIFDLEEEESKIARDIVKKNDNKRPIDLQDQVDERMQPKIDKLYKDIFTKK